MGQTIRTACSVAERNTDHIEEILLRPDPLGYDDTDPNIKAVQKELRAIYQNMIRPVEKQFRYADLRRHTMSGMVSAGLPERSRVVSRPSGKCSLRF